MKKKFLLVFLLTAAFVGASVVIEAQDTTEKNLQEQSELKPVERDVNLQSFDYVWQTVQDHYWDQELGGVDWEAARAEFRPQVAAATTNEEARRATRQLLAKLKVSHFAIILESAYSTLDKDKPRGRHNTGMDVRIVEDKVLVTEVREASPAAELGVKTGWQIIVNAGIEGEVESWYAKANKLIAIMSAEAIGTVHKGSTGNVMWSMSDMSGPVIEEGFAAETQLRDSTFDRLGYWDQVYESAKVVAMEEIDGKKHYKVVLMPRPFQSVDVDEFESAEYAIWLDVKTGLASRLEGNIFSSAGTVPVIANMSDYREIDGIKIAHETKMEIMGQTRIMRIQEIKQNLELSANKFDPPEEITSLLKKKGEDD